MPTPSTRSPSPPTKRLLQELRDHATDPLPFLAHLGPANDDQLFEWTAVMRGPEGTAYESIYPPFPRPPPASPPLPAPTMPPLTPLTSNTNGRGRNNSRTLAPNHPPPPDLPPPPPLHKIHHKDNPPQHLLLHGGNMSRSSRHLPFSLHQPLSHLQHAGKWGQMDASVYGSKNVGGGMVDAEVSGGG